jgi:hypothetical protein
MRTQEKGLSPRCPIDISSQINADGTDANEYTEKAERGKELIFYENNAK